MRAYLNALSAGDCDTARQLSTPIHVRVGNIWCDGPQVASVEAFTIEDAADVGDEMIFALRVVIIGGDVGIPPGDTMFCQVHRQPNGAWLVNGCGSGP